MKAITIINKLTVTFSALFVLLLSPAAVYAQAAGTPAPTTPAPGTTAPATTNAAAPPTGSRSAVCEGIGITGGTADCSPSATDPDIPTLISKVINIISMFVGVAAVIMIMIGGIKYVVSGGDANGISSAKNTILYALIGLAVALLAQVIVRFVINKI